jgi:hypothetical protein
MLGKVIVHGNQLGIVILMHCDQELSNSITARVVYFRCVLHLLNEVIVDLFAGE